MCPSMRHYLIWAALLLSPLAACEVGTDTCRRRSDPAGPTGGDGACEHWSDCDEGLDCYAGACVEGGHVDEPCESGGFCFGELTCVDGVCHGTRHVGPGGRCDFLDEEPCADGYFCSPFGDGTAECAPRGERDERCNRDGSCVDGLHCLRSGVCGDLPFEGELCSYARACADGLTCIGERCEPPAVAIGDICEVGACPTGLYCHDGACASRLATGDGCDPYNGERACAEGSFCQYSTLTCQVIRVAGETCERRDLCEGTLVCQLLDVTTDAWACADGLPAGGSCADGQVCGAGTYCDYRRRVELPSHD